MDKHYKIIRGINMNPLISVIVPIYKVEKFLGECVESILTQTYTNLEIILVDDGSPDNCGSICDEYAQKDSRIKVIHKQNGGLSDARNAGLIVFKGEYLVFVDSDDFMPKDSIEYMYNLAIKNDADLVIGGSEKFDENTGKIIWSTYNGAENVQVFDKAEAMKDFFINGCASWARLYKRKVHNNVFFPVGEINEDEAIVLTILENCEKIVKSNYVVYNYRYRENSITSVDFNKNKLAWYEHCENNLKYIELNYPALTDVAKSRCFVSVLYFLEVLSQCDKKLYNDLILEFKIILKSNYANILKNKFISLRIKLELSIINIFGLNFYSVCKKIISLI